MATDRQHEQAVAWDHPTLSKEEFAERLHEVTVAESVHAERWFWCSFADPKLAKGEQFLGVAIVRARGVVGAAMEARRLGINPGGEVQAIEIDDDRLHLFPAALRERLLSRADLEKAGLV